MAAIVAVLGRLHLRFEGLSNNYQVMTSDGESLGMRRARVHTATASRFGGLPRSFWILWAGTLVNRLGTMAVPFMSLYLVSVRGFAVVDAGAVVAGYGGGSLGSQLLGGYLSDRLGSRQTVLGGTLASAVVLGSLAYARSVIMIVGLVVMLGLTLELYRPAAQSLVMDLVPPAKRARAFSLLFWAANLGFAVAMTLGGFLAQTSFTDLFLFDALTGVTFGILVVAVVPESGRRPGGNSPGGYRAVLADRTMVAFAVCVVIYYFVYFQCDSTFPLAMRASGFRPSLYGLCMALNGVLISVVSPLVGPRLLRRRPGHVWAAGAVVVGLGFGLNAFAQSSASYLGTVAIWTLGEILPAAASGAIVSVLAPNGQRGRYAGLYGLAWSSGWLTSSLGGTSLLSVSPQLLWAACGVLGTAAAIGVLMLAPRIAAHAVGPPE